MRPAADTPENRKRLIAEMRQLHRLGIEPYALVLHKGKLWPVRVSDRSQRLPVIASMASKGVIITESEAS